MYLIYSGEGLKPDFMTRVLVRPKQHAEHTAEKDNGSKQAGSIQMSRKCRTDLINHQCHHIS